MDRVPQLNRKPLSTNPNKQTRKSEFNFNNNLGYKSKAEPSIISWANRGKGQMQVWVPRKITNVSLSSK